MKLKYLVIFISGILLVLLYFYVNPSEVNFLPKCPLYVTTGIYCPGCGSQRATHELLHFHLLGVLKQNALYVLGLLILAYHIIISLLNSFFHKKVYNYIYHPKTPLVLLIIILIFWILRNLPFYPFNLLAPQ
jgi:hypothetical protein